MNRREVLKLGAAGVAATSIVGKALGQTNSVWRNDLGAYSRTLHWLRSPEEIAQACHEIGNATIDLTVRPYPGHVLPENVARDLPPFVNALAQNGIRVTKIAMDVTDADTPYAEAMMDAASSVGVHHTWWRGLNFDPALTYAQQLDSLYPRVERFAALLEKYQFKACYHPGGTFTQLLDLCRPFDPRNIAISYDTGNFGQFTQSQLAMQIRMGGSYIGSVVFKDNVVEQLTPEQMALSGRNASPNGWTRRQVPVGTGILDLPLVCRALKDINFQGPMECQPEWPELGGAGSGRDTLTISRQEAIRLLRRDYLTVSVPLAEAGVI